MEKENGGEVVAVWYIDIDAERNKGHFFDAQETLVISDKEGLIKYLLNCHGRVEKHF